MQSNQPRAIETEQLELFGQKTNKPNWQSLPPKAKQQAAMLLAQLIADYVSNQTATSDQKELIDE